MIGDINGINAINPITLGSVPEQLRELRERVAELECFLGLGGEEPLMLRVHLSPQEQALLRMLLRRAPRTLSKEQAYTSLYGMRPEADQPAIKLIDIYICKLRARLRPQDVAIGTAWGLGWYLTPEAVGKIR